MSPWLFGFLAVFGVVSVVAVWALVQVVLTKRHLRRLFAGRTPDAALNTCRTSLPDIEPHRVELAYRWVQELVPFEQPPIHANDNLWSDLLIDQGNADDRLESSQEWLGQSTSQPAAAPPYPSPQTVRDLMAIILAYGYEGYLGGNAAQRAPGAA
jgi:hypothetical protein